MTVSRTVGVQTTHDVQYLHTTLAESILQEHTTRETESVIFKHLLRLYSQFQLGTTLNSNDQTSLIHNSARLEGVVEGYTHTVHTANLYAVLHSWLRFLIVT